MNSAKGSGSMVLWAEEDGEVLATGAAPEGEARVGASSIPASCTSATCP
jgi:hypothetical protein